MTVARPPRKKPTLVDEITRTLQTFDILTEALDKRDDGPLGPRTQDAQVRLLEIADRIAARTED